MRFWVQWIPPNSTTHRTRTYFWPPSGQDLWPEQFMQLCRGQDVRTRPHFGVNFLIFFPLCLSSIISSHNKNSFVITCCSRIRDWDFVAQCGSKIVIPTDHEPLGLCFLKDLLGEIFFSTPSHYYLSANTKAVQTDPRGVWSSWLRTTLTGYQQP